MASSPTDPRSKSALCFTQEAESVLASTNVTADGGKDYEAIVQKFEGFFKVRRNVIFERARFNWRN